MAYEWHHVPEAPEWAAVGRLGRWEIRREGETFSLYLVHGTAILKGIHASAEEAMRAAEEADRSS
jgi:hypothetical protein